MDDANSNGIFDEPISCTRTDSNIVTVNPKANFDPSLSTGVEGNSYCAGDTITVLDKFNEMGNWYLKFIKN